MAGIAEMASGTTQPLSDAVTLLNLNEFSLPKRRVQAFSSCEQPLAQPP